MSLKAPEPDAEYKFTGALSSESVDWNQTAPLHQSRMNTGNKTALYADRRNGQGD